VKKEIVSTRIFNTPVELVWEAFTDPELVMRWWGPDKFTSPSAKIDFNAGKSSVVCMRAPIEFGGQDTYNVWTYIKIIPYETIEYIQNLSDENGNIADPIKWNMPADFPKDTETLVTFKSLAENKTEITFREFADFGQMFNLAKIGLEQCLDKMVAIFDEPTN
jgi:uncharacterized protein YndB with AHSA1/START domain